LVLQRLYYKNNFLVSGCTALVTLFLAILSGYALSRFRFPWNRWIVAVMTPFTSMLMPSFFEAVPKAIEDAACLDGSGRLGILVRIVISLVKPGIVAVVIYAFLMTWDDYLHGVTLIQNDALKTLSAGVALRCLGELSCDWSLINSISIVGMLPVIVLLFFFQKYMAKGLVAGAVKG
jgi:multiple sugar transport system permease protein